MVEEQTFLARRAANTKARLRLTVADFEQEAARLQFQFPDQFLEFKGFKVKEQAWTVKVFPIGCSKCQIYADEEVVIKISCEEGVGREWMKGVVGIETTVGSPGSISRWHRDY